MRDFWWENHETLTSHVTLLYLVGGIPTPLKNMKVNGKDDIPYMKWKIKAMFQTTNQYITISYNIYIYNIIDIYIYIYNYIIPTIYKYNNYNYYLYYDGLINQTSPLEKLGGILRSRELHPTQRNATVRLRCTSNFSHSEYLVNTES